VAKILVADDNSNVQKTMALALADLGVEVVSVNNGEAAVRKLAEVSPDLVLADIFMPVRNGYEVCEYVKKDPKFSHVPVVLLVGAFDPFDEREALRVGADGILKKPFVPPDPLISMVKSLLERVATERLVAVSASPKFSSADARKSADTVVKVTASAPAASEESQVREIPVPPSRVSFGEGDHPVAFGELLGLDAKQSAAPVAEPVKTADHEPADHEQILTSSRDATLGEPIFWRSDLPKAQTEADAEELHPAKVADELSLHNWGQDKGAPLRREEAQPLSSLESVELVLEDAEQASPLHIDTGSILLDPADQAPITVNPEKAPDLSPNATDWLSSEVEHQFEPLAELAPASVIEPIKEAVAEHKLDAAPEPVLEATPEPAAAVAETLPVSSAAAPVEVPAHIEPVAEPHVEHAVEDAVQIGAVATQSPEDTAKSIPVEMWAEMTDAIETRAAEIVIPHHAAESIPETASHEAAVAAPVSHAVEAEQPQAAEVPAASIEPAVPAVPVVAQASQPTGPDPELVEAVVQRVLEKMRPQVVDIITKEFLRPVVQALVHREIEKH
jgi:CheY-like chemotaxis protein